MKKITVFFEIPGMTSQQYDAILAAIKEGGKLPDTDRPSHVAFQKENAWCVVDVWNSEEAFMNFGKNVLFPIFQKIGIQPPQPAVFPVHHFVGTEVEEYSTH
ncbi:MAG: hypothetical protein JNM68_03710 [Dinghuibacter sp.]|nr:hypothetical protein [Dinghuibacter sp.]